MPCIAMKILQLAATVLLLIWPVSSILSQDTPQVISADNVSRLVSTRQIDFSRLEGNFELGWFAANVDASEILIVDRDMRVYRVSQAGQVRELPLAERSPDDVTAILDALFLYDTPVVLYRHGQNTYINQHQLGQAEDYLALFGVSERREISVEATDADGNTIFLRYQLSSAGDTLTYVGLFAFPSPDQSAPAVRIGRIAFPYLMLSSLNDGGLTVFKYSDSSAFAEEQYALAGGPAVAGALNGDHFAWIDPWSERLNLLNLASGENRVVTDLGGSYAQYVLLTRDASAIIAVNLDFEPHVFAWNAETGRRFDLGPYRECERIPDRVSLSEDGASLIIGCDSGLDIWQIKGEG